MVLIFDLDDTLYDERTYVESGLRAVARFAEGEFGWDAEESFQVMIGILDNEGRGAIFDHWLATHCRTARGLVETCIKVYRHHRPELQLNAPAQALLPQISHLPLYIVTDGHKIVQALKVEALGIAPLFRRIFISHRYGLRHAKPSTYCFRRVRMLEHCDWSDMTYIGDNPAKDFVGLNRLGMQTVRVLTGTHRSVKAKPGHDARITIADLTEVMDVLPQLQEIPRPGSP